jgi:RNA polymerase-binding transcription factor DksA
MSDCLSMSKIESYQHSNVAEEEMGQLHGSIDIHLNAIEAVRRIMPTGPSLEECVDCGGKIPLARQQAALGCRRCIHCQGLLELQK